MKRPFTALAGGAEECGVTENPPDEGAVFVASPRSGTA